MKKPLSEVIKTYQEAKSIRKTAALTGYSKSGVEYLLKANGVELFPRNRSGEENSIRKAIDEKDITDPSRLVRDKVYMTELYVTKRMSTTEIGKLIGFSASTVREGLHQCNIPLRTKSESLKGKPRPNTQGSKNKNWKGGLSGWRKLARGRLNEHFVRPIMERDGFCCQWCCSNKSLVVHHSKRTFMEIVELVKSMCDATDIDVFVSGIIAEHKLEDGITLCKECHDNFHRKNNKR